MIIDFDGAEGDRLNVSDFGFADFATFCAFLTPEGPGGRDTRITQDTDTVVILENITPDDLVASHVILAADVCADEALIQLPELTRQ